MKVYEIVAVYDNLAEAYMQPNFMGSLAEAQRLFEYQINNIKLWQENPEDYELWSLGTYNAEEGSFISEKHKLIKGTAVVRKENNSDIRSAENTETSSNS